MDLRRLRPPDVIAGLSGIGLVVLMFLDWYGPGGTNAWGAFAVIDVLLLIAAAWGIALLVVTALQPASAVPIATASFTAIFGTLALALVVIRVLFPPDIGPGATTRSAGAWLGLAAAALLAASAWLAMRSERLDVPGTTDVPITALPAPRGGSPQES